MTPELVKWQKELNKRYDELCEGFTHRFTLEKEVDVFGTPVKFSISISIEYEWDSDDTCQGWIYIGEEWIEEHALDEVISKIYNKTIKDFTEEVDAFVAAGGKWENW